MTGKPSQVSIPRATYHYFTDMQNFLLATGTACFLGKHLVHLARYLGKDVGDFPSLRKISNATDNYFAFYDLASAAKSFYSTCSVLSGGVQVLRGVKTLDGLRADRKGDAPRADNSYIGVKTWMTYKTISSLFKAVSSLLLVHQTLKHIGSFSKSYSPKIRAIGGGLGAAGAAISILDIQRAHMAHVKDVAAGACPSDAMVKNPSGDDFETYRTMTQAARRYDQVFLGLVIFVKLTGVARALNMVENRGLIGRASRFVINHSDNWYGALFAAMTATGLIKHALYGATIQQLEKRDVNK